MSARRVPLLDLRRDADELDPALEAAFRRVLRSGQYILGPEVAAFERECEERLGVAHAVGVSSGSDALLLSLMALGVGRGDEVVCPTFTFFATAGAVARLGATPVFADVTPCCYGMAAGSAEVRASRRTRALLPVHLFGQLAHLEPLLSLATSRHLVVVEDAAQAFGAPGAGAAGSLGCFSFFPSKNLGALGDGGLVVTADPALADRARLLRTHGSRPKFEHAVVGGNLRLDELQAALLRVKLARVEGALARRRANASRYHQLFAATGLAAPGVATSCTGIPVPGADPTARVQLPVECRAWHTYHQYVIRVPGEGVRDRLRAHLAGRGVATEVYYPVPMHLQRCFAELGGRPGDLPVAEAAARETLALPVFPGLLPEEIGYVVDAVAAFMA